MPNRTPQPDYVSNTCRTISGQLDEWGIEFSPDRVSQLTVSQQDTLQSWINAGVDADEAFLETFPPLPEFMENELLEMRGVLSNSPAAEIIEQAINAYEAEAAITDNPYLFDTSAWILWRTAYCRWHQGASLDDLENYLEDRAETKASKEMAGVQQALIQLAPQLSEAERALKTLRRQIKQVKQLRNSYRKQQSQLVRQLCESFELQRESDPPESVQKITDEKSSTDNQSESSEVAPDTGYSTIVRIPVGGPETNRIEVLLVQDKDQKWRAGHLWTVQVDPVTGPLSRGSQQPGHSPATYHTETDALINEVILLSRKLSGLPEIEEAIVDYLNRLEEFPGQISVCDTCRCHFINETMTEPDTCPNCVST